MVGFGHETQPAFLYMSMLLRLTGKRFVRIIYIQTGFFITLFGQFPVSTAHERVIIFDFILMIVRMELLYAFLPGFFYLGLCGSALDLKDIIRVFLFVKMRIQIFPRFIYEFG